MKYYLFSLLGFAFFWNPLLRRSLAQYSSVFLFYLEDVAGCLCLILYSITFLRDLFPVLAKLQLYCWRVTLFFCLSFFPSFLIFLIPQSAFWIINFFIANFFASSFLSKRNYLLALAAGFVTSVILHLCLKSKINVAHSVTLYAYFIITLLILFFQKKDSSQKYPDYSAKLEALEAKVESYIFFIQYISHELRIPLQGIKGLAGLLISKEDSISKKRIEYLNILQSSCTQLLITASRVLDFSKFMSERGVLKRTRCNIRQIISNVIAEMQPFSVLQNSSIEFYCSLTDVYVDGPKVTHIIRNLLSNALQNTKNGRIRVQVFLMKEDFLYISVIDTGVGISTFDSNKIFDKFNQADFSQNPDSSGVGLFIVSYFVHIHKGKIWAENNTPTGAIFTFTLELGRAFSKTRGISNLRSSLAFLGSENIFWNNVTEHTLSMARLWTKKSFLHALIVDDDDLSLLSSSLILENVGFTITKAKNCSEALKALENKKIDLILLDVVIGKDDIQECLKKIINQSEKSSIILQTGMMISFLNSITLCKGVIGYVLKPYGPQELCKILTALSKV